MVALVIRCLLLVLFVSDYTDDWLVGSVRSSAPVSVFARCQKCTVTSDGDQAELVKKTTEQSTEVSIHLPVVPCRFSPPIPTDQSLTLVSPGLASLDPLYGLMSIHR